MEESVYDRLIAVYRRAPQGSLIRCFGNHEQSVQSKWAEIQEQLHPRPSDPYGFIPNTSLHGDSWPCGVAKIQGQFHPHSFDAYPFMPNISRQGTSWPRSVATMQGQLHPHSLNPYRFLSNVSLPGPSWPCGVANIHEVASPDSGPIIGLILRPASNENDMSSFDEYFAHILLPRIAELSKIWELPESVSNGCSIAEQVAELCNTELLVHSPNSQWYQLGRSYLTQKLSFFTMRGLPIQMSLPAFPCKSSNPEKVSGAVPDRGEELALRRLYSVLRKIEDIYQPGATLCIISDGHVFSDCIGVDDDQVDRYGNCLRELNHMIGVQEEQGGQITFQSLKDIFHSTPEHILGKDKALQIKLPPANHFLDTDPAPDTEFCRQAMTLASQPDRTSLRRFIQNQESSTLSLYRGFSRFMLEDLALHPRSVCTSRSQQKKFAEKIAFEMLLRSQAYSNLVELFFPDHIRLSIHAHVNSGPKFAINMFDRARIRVVDNLDDLSIIAQPCHELLHIPTPWHNCVFQLSQNDIIFVTKNKVIQKALKSNRVHARWIHPDRASASGGYFEVGFCESPSEGQEVTSTEVTTEATTEKTTEMTTEASIEMTTEAPTETTIETTTEMTTEVPTETTIETTIETTTEMTTGAPAEMTTEAPTSNATSDIKTDTTIDETTDATINMVTHAATHPTTDAATDATIGPPNEAATGATPVINQSIAEKATPTTGDMDTTNRQRPRKHRHCALPRLRRILRFDKIRMCL